jgi:hypothetical protein
VTRTFIADASVAVGWVHPGQATTHTASMLDAIAEGAIVEVPALWPSELASAHQLSVYDAAYLELAQRRRLVLGCEDGPLRKAAKQSGVSLWE